MSSDAKDDKPWQKIKPYNGERGAPWREFRRDVMATARGKFSKDDKTSWLKTLIKMDEGGTAAGAPALPDEWS